MMWSLAMRELRIYPHVGTMDCDHWVFRSDICPGSEGDRPGTSCQVPAVARVYDS